MAELPNLNKQQRAAAEHATDFDVPIYNIWKQQSKSEGSQHFHGRDLDRGFQVANATTPPGS